jgi:hypothetical protein
MTIYTRFSDIPDAVWVDGDLIGKHPLETYARLTEWILYNTPDESMSLSAVPAGYRESVSDALWNDDVATYDGVLTPQRPGDKPLRRLAVSLITKLHEGDLSFADVTKMCGSEDTAYTVIDWCSRRRFAQQRGGIVSLDGILARLRDYTEPKPTAAPRPATAPKGQSQEKVTRPAAVTVPKPAPAPAPVPIPVTRPAGQSVEKVTRPVHVTAEPLDPLIVRAVRALELMAENQLPRPVEIIPKGDSSVVDCARELAILLDALGPVTKNVLRERVRARLRPFTVHALEYSVKNGAFQLVGNPARGGEYTLIDPEPLGMSWGQVKSMSARRKPARALAGTRGT